MNKFKKDDKVINSLTGQMWIITMYIWQGLYEMHDPDPLWKHNKVILHQSELTNFTT